VLTQRFRFAVFGALVMVSFGLTFLTARVLADKPTTGCQGNPTPKGPDYTCENFCFCVDIANCAALQPAVACAVGGVNANYYEQAPGDRASTGTCTGTPTGDYCYNCATYLCAVQGYYNSINDFGDCSGFCQWHATNIYNVCTS
jgi:hypothetical protein